MKSKLSTAKKSKTTTFSRVFHPKKNQQFSREIKVEFLDKKNEDFEQCKFDNFCILGARKAEEFIWSQRDKLTGFWPRDEAANAVLGLGIRSANLASGVLTSLASNESESIRQNMERIHSSFLMELIRSVGQELRKDENPKKAFEKLQNMDEQVVLTLVGALKTTCAQDPRNYFGYNLLDFLFERLMEQFNELGGLYQSKKPRLSYPSLVLALCVNDDPRLINNEFTDRLELLVPLYPFTLNVGEFQPLGIGNVQL